MTQFTLTIACDNAAFDESPAQEVARILRELADKMEFMRGLPSHCPINDANGNKVGFAQVDESTCRNCDGAGCRHCDRDASY